MRFNISMTGFFRVEVRRIQRQPLDLNDIGIGGQEIFNQFGRMNAGMIPDDDQPLLMPAQQMQQKHDYIARIESLADVLLVDAPGQAQAHNRRELPPLSGHAPQLRGFPLGAQVRPKGAKNEKPTSSIHTIIAPWRRAFF